MMVVATPPVVRPIAPVIGAEMVSVLKVLNWLTTRSAAPLVRDPPALLIVTGLVPLTFGVSRMPPVVIVFVPPARLMLYPTVWLVLLNRRQLVVEPAAMVVVPAVVTSVLFAAAQV